MIFIILVEERISNVNLSNVPLSLVKCIITRPENIGSFPLIGFISLLFIYNVSVTHMWQRLKVVSMTNTEEFLSRQQNFSISYFAFQYSQICYKWCSSNDAPVMVTILIKVWEFLWDWRNFARLSMSVLIQQVFYHPCLLCLFDCASVSFFLFHLKLIKMDDVPLILLTEYCTSHLDAFHYQVSYVVVPKQLCCQYLSTIYILLLFTNVLLRFRPSLSLIKYLSLCWCIFLTDSELSSSNVTWCCFLILLDFI